MHFATFSVFRRVFLLRYSLNSTFGWSCSFLWKSLCICLGCQCRETSHLLPLDPPDQDVPLMWPGSDYYHILQLWCCDLHHVTGSGPSVSEPFAEQRCQSVVLLSGCQGDSLVEETRVGGWHYWLCHWLKVLEWLDWVAITTGKEQSSWARLRHVPLPLLLSGGTGNLSITDEVDVSWKHMQCAPPHCWLLLEASLLEHVGK